MCLQLREQDEKACLIQQQGHQTWQQGEEGAEEQKERVENHQDGAGDIPVLPHELSADNHCQDSGQQSRAAW